MVHPSSLQVGQVWQCRDQSHTVRIKRVSTGGTVLGETWFGDARSGDDWFYSSERSDALYYYVYGERDEHPDDLKQVIFPEPDGH